jgi:ribosomal protein S18 acetylase RimI-like enzyme
MKIERDIWLTNIFGHDVFKVSLSVESLSERDPKERVDTLIDYASGQPVFFYTKISTTCVDQVEAMTSIGFNVVDVNVTFEKKPVDIIQQKTSTVFKIRDCLPAEYEAVLDVAASCFKYSRFHLDPHVPNELANAIKRTWIESYTQKKRGERLLVCLIDGKPVGFLAVLAISTGDQQVCVIDLIGIDSTYCGRGLGKGLINYFVNTYVGECDLFRVGTQAANIPSMRLYEGSGFRVAETSYVLHAHLQKGKLQR